MGSWFSNLSVLRKIVFVAAVALAGVALSSGLSLRQARVDLMDGREREVKSLVEAAVGVAARWDAEAKSGRMEESEARRRAMEDIRAMRYGGSGYLWINDHQSRMLMHPVSPDLEGRDLSETKTPDGRPLFAEMAALVKAKEAGFYAYAWPKPGSTAKAVPKISYVKGYAPWGWIVGTGVYIDDVDDAFLSQSLFFAALIAAIFAACGAAAWAAARAVAVPISKMTAAMGAMAAGDLSIRGGSGGRKDEVGRMADALEVFRKAMAAGRAESEIRIAEDEQKAAMSAAQSDLTKEFNVKMMEMAQAVVAASEGLRENSGAMSASAERTGEQAVAVAAAGEEAAANVETVAAATEELSASSREIAAQIHRAVEMAQAAAQDAKETDVLVAGMAEAAERIGDVVKLISDIASQTNLLALNATIEAARAGEAGKGFAVVANEVKTLASQTAKATEEISVQISAVRSRTSEAAAAVSKISSVVRDMDEVTGAIAAAVEEQGAATREIARNVQEAHAGTADVAKNASGVGQSAKEGAEASHAVSQAADLLLAKAEGLQAATDDFIVRLQCVEGLEWGASWETGNPSIDSDHRKLVELVNGLNKAMAEGAGRSSAGAVLSELVSYTKEHFVREEGIWRDGGLSSLVRHQEFHGDLLRKVEAFAVDFSAGRAELTTELMAFLRDWLMDHVFRSDKAAVLEIASKSKRC